MPSLSPLRDEEDCARVDEEESSFFREVAPGSGGFAAAGRIRRAREVSAANARKNRIFRAPARPFAARSAIKR